MDGGWSSSGGGGERKQRFLEGVALLEGGRTEFLSLSQRIRHEAGRGMGSVLR